ncbi:pectin lyase fold/virulence factor [Geopyxis carbonaria]|nr:pectin lyase fold/virulence factor [Geopyxis carbonaria]
MKFGFSLLVTLTCAASALAAPLVKRASLTEAATTGFATLNGGTTGGAGGTTVSVSTLSELQSAASSSGSKIIKITKSITGAGVVKVASDKTIVATDYTVVLTGVAISIKSVSNVILRNLTIKKVLAATGDAIGIQASQNVWIDHVDLSSDTDNGKDYYDGLLDITHACDYVTVTYSYLHDHYKASLVGHSDDNGAEDSGHLTVSYMGNLFANLNSRGPSFRFGTGHLWNNFYSEVSDGINTRQGAQLLVENNVFYNSKKPLYSTDGGYATASGNDFGDAENTAPAGTKTSSNIGYSYSKAATADVWAMVVGPAGATLTF